MISTVETGSNALVCGSILLFFEKFKQQNPSIAKWQKCKIN